MSATCMTALYARYGCEVKEKLFERDRYRVFPPHIR